MAWLDGKKSLRTMKEALVKTTSKVADSVSSVGLGQAVGSVKDSALNVVEHAKEAGTAGLAVAAQKAGQARGGITGRIQSFEFSEIVSAEYYRESFVKYKDLSSTKISEYFNATFEVDKTTMEMVDGIRSHLPVPATTVDDIFEQCKKEAMKRAIASFCLSGVMHNIDQNSAAKYENLSESYSQFYGRTGNGMFDHPNFAAMKNAREDARKDWTLLEDGYNSDVMLDPYGADVEHVIARKAYYDDVLLRAGTTDDDFVRVINSKDNLVFANDSLNRAMKEKNIFDYLAANGTPRSDDPDLIDVTIKRTGEVVTVRLSDVEETVERAEGDRSQHRMDAVKEIGVTLAKTGGTMAVQQVVGLIVLETIDIFIDEVRDMTVNGNLMNDAGLINSTKDRGLRIRQRLNERFEERQIWVRAKSLGIEAGVSGALSVIPQILISLIVKMPAFVLAMIRECTLSVVRCVRVLASKDSGNKLEAIGVILAGTASAVVGVYVGRVIGNALVGVPLLNKFNSQITSVLTGLLVTAVPLAAIYTFDQQKTKLRFMTAGFAGTATGTVAADEKVGE
ncbi:MAG: hypothetical protein KJ945_19790 [Gammaproteobacteria bacterium]|nr:hypothetical protein [Gammaproteobacteria bacterium]MBU1806347.1 hypothetical protein [Gammaproteobacteria bacterium]